MFDTLYQSLTNLDLCSVGSHSSKVGGHRTGGGGGGSTPNKDFFSYSCSNLKSLITEGALP